MGEEIGGVSPLSPTADVSKANGRCADQYAVASVCELAQEERGREVCRWGLPAEATRQGGKEVHVTVPGAYALMHSQDSRLYCDPSGRPQ